MDPGPCFGSPEKKYNAGRSRYARALPWPYKDRCACVQVGVKGLDEILVITIPASGGGGAGARVEKRVGHWGQELRRGHGWRVKRLVLWRGQWWWKGCNGSG